MKKTYLELKKDRDILEKEKNQIIFGLMGGIILMAVGALNWLSSGPGVWEIVCICIAALGVIFFLLAIIVPAFLKYPYKAFRFWGNLVGKVLSAVVLAILYFLFIFPVGLFLRRKREEQGYFSWGDARPQPRSMFADLTQSENQPDSAKASYLGILYRLLVLFAANKKYVLIPAVIVLVIVGLILFFVSTNVVTGFIYTLF